jgi:hypothetical protein
MKNLQRRWDAKLSTTDIADTGYRILLTTTISILASTSRRKDRIRREATEIELHPNTNREDGFSLSRSWKPLIHSQKEMEEVSLQEQPSHFLLLDTPLPGLSMGENRTASLLPISWGPEKGRYIPNSQLEFCSCDKNLRGIEKAQLVSIFHKCHFPPESSSGFMHRPFYLTILFPTCGEKPVCPFMRVRFLPTILVNFFPQGCFPILPFLGSQDYVTCLHNFKPIYESTNFNLDYEGITFLRNNSLNNHRRNTLKNSIRVDRIWNKEIRMCAEETITERVGRKGLDGLGI